jgi:hypothetical protein
MVSPHWFTIIMQIVTAGRHRPFDWPSLAYVESGTIRVGDATFESDSRCARGETPGSGHMLDVARSTYLLQSAHIGSPDA